MSPTVAAPFYRMSRVGTVVLFKLTLLSLALLAKPADEQHNHMSAERSCTILSAELIYDWVADKQLLLNAVTRSSHIGLHARGYRISSPFPGWSSDFRGRLWCRSQLGTLKSDLRVLTACAAGLANLYREPQCSAPFLLHREGGMGLGTEGVGRCRCGGESQSQIRRWCGREQRSRAQCSPEMRRLYLSLRQLHSALSGERRLGALG